MNLNSNDVSRVIWISFTLSVAVHALIAMTLSLPDVISHQKSDEISLGFVISQDGRPNARSMPLAKNIDANEPSQKSEVAIGESDVESSLPGRAPKDEAERYLAEIRDRIASQQTYPISSKSFREEGIVRIRLTLSRSGSLVKIELIDESPYKRLNDAAMRAATRASPFRSFPQEVKFETWRITLPVRFTLAQN